MTEQYPTSERRSHPPIQQLGADLLRLTQRQRWTTIAIPFLCCGIYFAGTFLGWWTPAVLAVVALSLFSYGSTSHDLVHRNLGLSRTVNEILLCATELLALRSGHAYRAAHLHHHARFPRDDDIESTAAGKSWLGAIAEGPGFQLRIWFWALRHARSQRIWIIAEGITCLALLAAAVLLRPLTPVPLIYAVLVILGSWPIPLITSYLPQDRQGSDELSQTRAFRGVVASIIALDHLYHLEHHLYPAVPHQNWRKLARRLDPIFAQTGVRPIRIWF